MTQSTLQTPDLSDWDLLQRYVTDVSHPAFEQLVHRHIDWVYSCARGQVQNPHLAEEVVQAVFLILSKKASRLSLSVILSGWLFRTTRFAAKDALKLESRRRHHEQQAAVMKNETPEPSTDW